MEDVLLEIDDGVIILEEKENEEDKEKSFSTVEFANSFMQRLLGSSFKKDSPESAETIKKLTKQPILSKTSKQTFEVDIEMDKLIPQEMNSVHDLVVASKQQDTPKNEKAFYLARRPEDLHQYEDEEPANSSVRTLV